MRIMSQETSRLIRSDSDALAHAIAARQYGIDLQAWQKYGSVGREKSIRDVGYHLAFLSEAIAHEAPVLFTDYVAWVKVMFDGLKFAPDTVEKTLMATQLVFHDNLPPEIAALADEYIQAGFDCLNNDPKPPPMFINKDLPLGGLARDYLDALLRGERRTASQLIADASARGFSVQDIYLHVFQRAQYEIGRLWQTNQISVAQEHFCTFATQLAMSQLSSQIYNTARLGRRTVATCVGGETHDMGMRMVTDFFEMSGWDTYYLGANTPGDSVMRSLVERRADLLAISVTISSHVSQAAELIQKVQTSEIGGRVKILVGGYPFNVSEDLWRAIHADGYGRDAQQALQVANELVGLAN
jgi:methanogenic corrinoid protein MtbC1